MIPAITYVNHDLKAFQTLISRVSNGKLTNPNQENEMALVIRSSQNLRKSLLAMEKALGVPRPAQ